MIHILGADGSMGKRYQAIFNYLGMKFSTSDIYTSKGAVDDLYSSADGFVIATPTNTHFDQIIYLEKFNKPILCEKPISKDLEELRVLERQGSLNLTMMAQYRMLDDPFSNGSSSYNYFRHGNDSLKWDCIQILGLARGDVRLADNSPIWKCRLNGRALSLSDMDMAYVKFVKRWIARPDDDFGRLLDWHCRAAEYE